MDGVAVRGNVIFPATSQLPQTGYKTGRSLAQDFLDATGKNVYPTSDSVLIDAGDNLYATSIDFNGTPRNGVPDTGAYTWTGSSNPGWEILEGFKNVFTSILFR